FSHPSEHCTARVLVGKFLFRRFWYPQQTIPFHDQVWPSYDIVIPPAIRPLGKRARTSEVPWGPTESVFPFPRLPEASCKTTGATLFRFPDPDNIVRVKQS